MDYGTRSAVLQREFSGRYNPGQGRNGVSEICGAVPGNPALSRLSESPKLSLDDSSPRVYLPSGNHPKILSEISSCTLGLLRPNCGREGSDATALSFALHATSLCPKPPVCLRPNLATCATTSLSPKPENFSKRSKQPEGWPSYRG